MLARDLTEHHALEHQPAVGRELERGLHADDDRFGERVRAVGVERLALSEAVVGRGLRARRHLQFQRLTRAACAFAQDLE
ncbi:MAG: hypothetical protein ACK55I_10365, partial [bacterium]